MLRAFPVSSTRICMILTIIKANAACFFGAEISYSAMDKVM